MIRITASLMALFAVTATVAAGEVGRQESQTIVRNGEIIAARPLGDPERGFELLVRHQGEIYICSTQLRTTYGADGVRYVSFGSCYDTQ